MNKIYKIDNLEIVSFLNGLVFFAPVSLLVRTRVGISLDRFFILQAVLSLVIFLGEIPTGKITDLVGYKNTIVLSQLTLLIARIMIMAAFLTGNYWLFMAEAVIEGISSCFASGTVSAYLYQKYNEGKYVVKSARVGNFGTAGFILSTIMYAGVYHFLGIAGLLALTAAMNFIAVPVSLGIEKDETHIDDNTDKPAAEKILDHIIAKNYFKTFIIGFIVSGVCMIIFGWIKIPLIIIPIMLLLPLMVSVPAYIFEEIENKVIDRKYLKDRRAEALSAYNMGVNLVEVVFLFASAYVAEAGMSACFTVVGLVMLLLAGVHVILR